MESKQMTLRSQTVQCPHCGEYYSVTYKYCPFCDAGRKAEAKKKAARKQQAASLFTGLFGSREEEPGMEAPPAHETSRRREPKRHPEQRRESAGEHRRRPAPAAVDIPRSEGFRKKKTSEMTEEEKRAYRAEREARAAARKRERDRAARAAALVDGGAPLQESPASEEAQATTTPVVSPTGMETVEITIDPMGAAPAAPAAQTELSAEEAVAQENAQAMDALQDLTLGGSGDQMEAAPVEAEVLPLTEQPVEVEVPTPVPEVKPRPVDPASILQGDSELDALLSEIRGLLDDGAPVENGAAAQTPEAVPQAAETAAQAVAEAVPQAEAAAQAAEAVPQAEAAAQAAEAVPQAEAAAQAAETIPQMAEAAAAQVAEAIPQTAEPATQTAEAASQTAEAAGAVPQAAKSAVNYDDPELLWSPETTAAVEAAAMRKTEPARNRTRRTTAQTGKQQGKKGLPLVPIIAAVIVIALAALLVAKVISPAIQGSKEAETIYLDKAEVTLTAPGATETLTPIFSPKGSSGEVKWTCDNWSVVDVNPEGVLTAQAPGVASVRATLPNGATTSTLVTCAWGDAAAAEGGATESTAPAEEVTLGLSATDMTLDGEGKTQQLTLNGATSAVKWTSSKPGVATVSADGTVTAVSKGSATVTAEANGSKYNCAVRCVW